MEKSNRGREVGSEGEESGGEGEGSGGKGEGSGDWVAPYPPPPYGHCLIIIQFQIFFLILHGCLPCIKFEAFIR